MYQPTAADTKNHEDCIALVDATYAAGPMPSASALAAAIATLAPSSASPLPDGVLRGPDKRGKILADVIQNEFTKYSAVQTPQMQYYVRYRLALPMAGIGIQDTRTLFKLDTTAGSSGRSAPDQNMSTAQSLDLSLNECGMIDGQLMQDWQKTWFNDDDGTAVFCPAVNKSPGITLANVQEVLDYQRGLCEKMTVLDISQAIAGGVVAP